MPPAVRRRPVRPAVAPPPTSTRAAVAPTRGAAGVAARTGRDGRAPSRYLDGLFLLGTGGLAGGLWTVRPELGFVPLAAPLLLAALRWFGVGAHLPGSRTGWLLAAVPLVTSVAPSMGTTGTVARTALAALCLVATYAQLTRATARLPRHASAALAVLLVCLLASALAAPSPGFGLSRLVNWTMFVPVLLLAYHRPEVRGVATGVIGAAVVQMLGVALQLGGLLGGTWGGLHLSSTSDSGSRLTRYTGFVANPNNLALLLALAVVVATVSLFARTTARIRVLCLALIPLFGVGVVLTGSRGGIVATALGLVVVVLWRGVRGWVLGSVIAGAVVAVAATTTSVGLHRVLESLSDLLAGTDRSANHRTAVWAEKLGSTDPIGLLRGSGFGGYDPLLFTQQRGLDVDVDLARRATVDNSWIKLLLESGLAGTVSMAVLLSAALVAALSRSRGGTSLLGVGAGAALVALLWRSASVDMLDQNPWNAIVFMTIGFALAAGRTDAGTGRSPGTPPAGRWAGVHLSRVRSPVRPQPARRRPRPAMS